MRFPKDENGSPIPVLSQQGAIKAGTTGDTSQSIEVGENKVITVTCSEDCFIKIGSSSDSAATTDWPIYARDKEVLYTRPGQTHLHYIKAASDDQGNLRVMINGDLNTN